ncbi:MAG: GatB/YqeY domain-containing protein [Flavobacteriales bacterium]|nr:GatB/YqeY domain-containing protein [Flavobacteriales bacterium]
MNLTDKINNDIKAAMLAKEKEKLEALRAIKSALLLLSTEKGASENTNEEAELKMLQKLVKQRKEAAEIFRTQGRADLADVEEFQSKIIEVYLPAQLSEDEIKNAVQQIITQTGAASAADFGKVMGIAAKQLGGKADGKIISAVVKQLLA